MDLNLTGNVVIVTGGTSGIGLATTELLTREGAHVVVLARGTTDVALPKGAELFKTDLTDPHAATEAVEAVRARHGRLDGLVNNAAILISQPSFADIDDEQWHRIFELNLHAGIRLIRAALRLLAAAEGGGSIVHIASEAARMPDPTIADYAAAKAALLSVSKSLAIDYGGRVRSNVISPGPTRTALFDAPRGFAEQLAERFELPPEEAIEHFIQKERRLPTGRIGAPTDIAGPVTYLLSARAAQVTGAEWSIDGGALRQI